jgi:hypothetical protein
MAGIGCHTYNIVKVMNKFLRHLKEKKRPDLQSRKWFLLGTMLKSTKGSWYRSTWLKQESRSKIPPPLTPLS